MIDFTDGGSGGPAPERSILERRCETCAYAVPLSSPILGAFMAQCHRSPPVPVFIQDGVKLLVQTHFPIVSNGAEYFCGDHLLKTLHRKG